MRVAFTIASVLVLLSCPAMSRAQGTLYWDTNGSAPGAGVDIDGFTDGTWGLDGFWSTDPNGEVATGPWVPGDNAVFSAGNDAMDHFIEVDGTQVANSLRIENGTVFLASGTVDTGAGEVVVEDGATLRINSTSRLNFGGKVVLNGGTIFQSNPGQAGSFLGSTPGAKDIEVNGSGVVNYTSLNDDDTPGAGTVSLFGTGGNGATILGVGGTPENGGAGTLIKRGANEFRYQGAGIPNTSYAQLIVEEGLFRLGFADQVQDTRGFGADPLELTPDAIILDGGAIGTSFFTSEAQVHPNRGVTVGPNGGTFNVSGGGLVINGPVTAGAGRTLTIVGGSTARLTNPDNVNTFNGNVVMNGTGVFDLVESLATPNLSGSGGAIVIAEDKTLTFGSDNADATYAGNFGGAGGIRKVGTGTQTLTGTDHTYTGDTIIEAGTLSSSSLFLPGAGSVFLTTGATLDLNFDDTDTITSLFFDGAAQSAGIWGAVGSGADFETSFLTGMGLLDVLSGAVADLIGDYNGDGMVDAADYTVWRDNLGGDGSNLLNRDPSLDGMPVGQDDYTFWVNNFGESIDQGSLNLSSAAVPEPAALVLAACGLVGLLACRRR